MHDNNLKIIHCNANGIRNKINELNLLLDTEKIDIALIRETSIKAKYPIKISNYKIYCMDNPVRPRCPTNSGTAILVHRQIVHSKIFPNTKLNSTSIEILTNQDRIRISVVYKRPQDPLDIDDLATLTNGCDWFVVAGDLNAKHPLWNSRATNPTVLVLYRHVQQTDYIVYAPCTPTHFPEHSGHRPDVLDIAMVKLPHHYTEVLNLNELSSDHNPILLNISDSTISSTSPLLP